MLSAESLLLIVVGAGLATGLPVAARYLPGWRAIKFLVPAAKHYRSRGGRDRPSVGAGFPLPKPAGEYRDDPYCGAPNMRAIKSLSMSTGSAASPLASCPWRKMTVIWALLFGLAHAAFAETILGRVVEVSDGDTITVLTREQKQIKVRLASIDAPEMAQPFGQRSKESLSGLCSGKEVRLETEGKDRYGRTIATVYVGEADANAQQVSRGLAWVFDRYAEPNSPLYALQAEAQGARRGLWGDSKPTPPWTWRSERRR